MSEWKDVKLGEICKTNVNTYSKNDNWDYVNYLDTGNVTENNINEIAYIDVKKNKLPSRAKRKVKIGDIVYSNVRPNQRHYGYFKNICSNFLVSTGFTTITINPEKADNKYIYYYITQDYITQMLHSLAEQSTSAYPSIKPSDIENIKVNLPTLPEQKAIASILSALDDKIELNNKINRNLQDQAKAIYKEMVIDLSEGEVTEGILSDIAVITMGQSPKGDTYNEEGNGAVFYQGRAEFGERFPTRRLFTTEPKRMASPNDVLMSVRAPVGDINVAYEECCIGRGLGAAHSKDGHQSFVLYTMLALREAFDIYNGEGTVFGSINKDAMNKMSIRIPTSQHMDKFEEIVSPIDTMIRKNYEETFRLVCIRDSLLPKLMSGELDVSDLDI